jgi:phosphoadenosine phosphosulfate reductase
MVESSFFAAPPGDYERLQDAQPREVLSWACDTIDRLAVTTSFQSSGLVILHLVKEMRPDIPVLFLDTGFHFEETLAFKQQITEAWDLKVVDLTGSHGDPARQAEIYGPELYRGDPDRCCFINKVEPLQRALEEFDAWISGIRRDQSPLRARTPVLEAQMLPSGREVLKIHPLASWTRADVEAYAARHEISAHPLLEQGYASIGCRPCTRRVAAGEAERDGRWDGFTKTECGIHSFGKRTTEAET